MGETDEKESRGDYVMQTMLTCIGNKRKLVKQLYGIIDDIRQQLGKSKLILVDGFAGSSVVSRQLSYLADTLYSNDMELYSYLMAQCYLVTPTPAEMHQIHFHISEMNRIAQDGPFIEGIICKLYAPQNTIDIKEGER
jgi:adenine-specific DNA-methyltransferase